ncbi:MAG: hypothetical protein N838_21160 [Thiohalocapsa sp. PB-PSB1]|jgi:hypothetical protein|nr:MAG: hypothetical protein N838_21160 [Thiohalocapsa sp. PB-PSB1]
MKHYAQVMTVLCVKAGDCIQLNRWCGCDLRVTRLSPGPVAILSGCDVRSVENACLPEGHEKLGIACNIMQYGDEIEIASTK